MSADTVDPIRVLVWGENRHEQIEPARRARSTPTACTPPSPQGIAENLGDRARVVGPPPSTSPSTD